YTWNGHQAVRHLRHPDLGPAETKRVDEHELACKVRPLERDLESDPPPQGHADDRGRTKTPVFDVALHEAREVGDGIAHAWLFGSPVPGKVGSENTMLGPRGFEVVPPLHVAGRPEPVDEHDRCAAAAVHVVNTQRSDLDELGLN